MTVIVNHKVWYHPIVWQEIVVVTDLDLLKYLKLFLKQVVAPLTSDPFRIFIRIPQFV